MGTTDATVLREADAAMGRKLPRFNLGNRCFDQPAELPSLLFGDRCLQVLNLRRILTDEYHQGDFGNPADPGITDQLGIKRQQAIGILRIPARGCLPIDDAALSVEFTDSVQVGNKLVASHESTDHLDLQVVLRRPNVNAVLLDESLEQVDTSVDQTIPGFTFFVLQRGISEDAPLVKERCAGILLAKQCCKSLFEATSEDHRRPSLLFPPSIEVAIP